MKHHLALLSRRFALTQLGAVDDFSPQARAFSKIDKFFPAVVNASPASKGFRRTALMILLLASSLQGTAVMAEEKTGLLSGIETWGGRPALPAVVNPVVIWPLQSVLRRHGASAQFAAVLEPLGAKESPAVSNIECKIAQGIVHLVISRGPSLDCFEIAPDGAFSLSVDEKTVLVGSPTP